MEKPVCELYAGEEAPYFAYGRAYIRVADEYRQLTARELENFILRKHQEAIRWDKLPCDAKITDLDVENVKRFVKLADLEWDSVDNVLDKLECLQDGWPVEAALLFFGKRPAKLKCPIGCVKRRILCCIIGWLNPFSFKIPPYCFRNITMR